MPTAASRLAVSLDLLASLYARMGNDEQAVKKYVQAIEALEKIAERYPAVAAYQRKLAETSYSLAVHHRSQGRADDALKRHQQASQLWERLLGNHPENVGLRYDLMRVYHRIAKIYLSGERFEEAAAAAKHGMDLFHDRPPKADTALAENKYMSLGVMHRKLGRIEARVARELEQR
jgi:tetratricopeptide (TPR) repeat protein